MRLRDYPSPNFNDRAAGAAINLLLIHYTGMETAEAALRRLCDPSAQVSAHYVIYETGQIFRLVPEAKRAWHAGVSAWRSDTDINSLSIGIELVNPGHDFGYRPFPKPQMEALAALAEEIIHRHSIPPERILGHSDVAPTRKQDPGELFNWQFLAANGIGLWPKWQPVLQPHEPCEQSNFIYEARRSLCRFGYHLSLEGARPDAYFRAVLTAFQRHFRPSRCDGRLDRDCLTRIQALAQMVPA